MCVSVDACVHLNGAYEAHVVQCGVVCFGVELCGSVWSCVVQCGVVWFSVELCGSVWSCVVRCGVVWSCVLAMVAQLAETNNPVSMYFIVFSSLTPPMWTIIPSRCT